MYRVIIDDNFHFMDESERDLAGTYPDCETARQQCIALVERSLKAEYQPGMEAKELLERYKSFGDDPWISGPDRECRFSAWEYAAARAKEICEAGGAGQKANEGP